MRKIQVMLPAGAPLVVEAYRFEIAHEGCLILFRGGHMVAAFAPGQWDFVQWLEDAAPATSEDAQS